MILSRFFDLQVYEISKLFQVFKDSIFSAVNSNKISLMNEITNSHGMNKEHEETNYCAFDDNRKLKGTKYCIFIYAKSSLKLLHLLYVR